MIPNKKAPQSIFLLAALALLLTPHFLFALPNLARSRTNPEWRTDEYVFINRSDDPKLFQKMNRSFPPPKNLVVKTQEVFSSEGEAKVRDLLRKKVKYLTEIDDEMAGLDRTVQSELLKAGVPAIKQKERLKAEVPSMYVGEFEGMKFYRGWQYWMIDAPDGLEKEFAQLIYADPKLREVVRVNGGAGSVDPAKEHLIGGYHVDSQEGLNEFMVMYQRYRLTKLGCAATVSRIVTEPHAPTSWD